MAKFEPAFEKTMTNEGGWLNHQVAGDKGGQTYAGIARRYHPDWSGWEIVDRGDLDNQDLTGLVREFYWVNFWEKIKGDEISDQEIAESIYDFAVNGGVKIAVMMAQRIVKVGTDGIMGPKTLKKINSNDPDNFIIVYTLGKVSRYAQICNKDQEQSKFLLGWINRTLGVFGITRMVLGNNGGVA